MGEWIWTNVRFGGKINTSDLDDIRDVLLGEDDFDEAVEKGMFCSTSGEVNYGDPEDLCGLLETLGISYICESECVAGYGGQIIRYDAETKTHTEFSRGNDGEPVLELAALRQMMNAGHSIGAAVARLAPAEWTPPPVEVVNDEGGQDRENSSATQDREPSHVT